LQNFIPQGNADVGRARILREHPEIRQQILRHFEQENPAIAQHLTENPEMFDSLLDMASKQASKQADQNPTMDEGDFEAIQSVSLQSLAHLPVY